MTGSVRSGGIVSALWPGATPEAPQNSYTMATLERHKREGLELALRVRWVSMLAIGILIMVLRPEFDTLYYEAILLAIAINGVFQRRAGRVGRSRLELFLIQLDVLLMVIGMIGPNPLANDLIPLAAQLEYENFKYFFIILAAGTLAYSSRTVFFIGIWIGICWTLGVGFVWLFAEPATGLSEAVTEVFADYPQLVWMSDPNNVQWDLRAQEVAVILIAALILSVSARRFDALLYNNAALERARANLSRYFSPNVVEELSGNDEPLKQVREQEIAVLFVDIVGFTKFASDRDPYAVIEVLRGFHARMEREVFRHNGTLDKYLGDGLMATFGTPLAGDRDATNALQCARAMIDAIDSWNIERSRAGEPPICAGIGVHFGPVVLGDIGANRLEFAVIGNPVNVASRLEAMTRTLKARLIVSDDLLEQVRAEGVADPDLTDGFSLREDQEIRGLERRRSVWMFGQANQSIA